MSASANVLFARLQSRSRLRQWQLVLQVWELGNLQRAAESVGMSQPAATQALAGLEELLGVPLFERHAKGTRATAAGEALLPLVRSAMKAFRDGAQVVAAMQGGTTTVLRVGAIGAAVSGLLSYALPAFSERHADIAVTVEQHSPEDLTALVAQGKLDVALYRRPEQLPTGTSFTPVLSDRYAVVCSPRHPLAERSGVTRQRLHDQTWLLPPSSAIADRAFHDLWEGGDLPSRLCWVETRLPLVMWAMLERRQALALIPYDAVRQWIDAGVLAEVPGSWGEPLAPLGALARAEALDERGPLADFLAELLAWTDLVRTAAPTGQS